MLKITKALSISLREIEISAIRAQGAGGQNVNKVSSAIHLRFNIMRSSLPEIYKKRLLQLADYRITSDGLVIIKAQRYRNQEQNRADALQRLQILIKKVTVTPKVRRATKPSKAAQQKRLETKVRRGQIKKTRANGAEDW